jgi:1-acyl-sn-glycerol-3-phosphate acyltransferase
MPRRISRAWRQLRTGSAFALFGIGGTLLALVVLPLAARGERRGGGLDLRAQRWIHRAYGVFVGYMERLALIRVRVTGAERLRGPGPRLVAANHPSLIDTPLLGALLPQADCLAKREWAESRALGPAIAAANYLRRDTGSAAVDDAVARLAAGRTVLIFPEGTRTPEGRRLGRLRRGAAHIALRSGVPITPVLITVEPRMLMKGRSWHDVPERRGEYTVRVLEPLWPKDPLEGGETPSVAARRLTAALARRLEEALDAHARAGAP